MSNLQILELLCEIIERQNSIILEQTKALQQLGFMCQENEIEEAKNLVNLIM